METWTDGRLQPLHAWYGLRVTRGDARQQCRARVATLLPSVRPRYVLVAAGPNPMDGDFTQNPAIEAGLRDAALT